MATNSIAEPDGPTVGSEKDGAANEFQVAALARPLDNEDQSMSEGEGEELKHRLSIQKLCSGEGPVAINSYEVMSTPTSVDQEMQDAVEALGDLRYADQRGLSEGGANTVDGETSPQFLNRMTQYSLVNGTMRVIGNITRTYEQTKENNVVVRYGAQAVESSVKTVTKPILNRYIEPNLDRINKFACNQLDKLERSFASKAESHGEDAEDETAAQSTHGRRRSISSDIMHPPTLSLGPSTNGPGGPPVAFNQGGFNNGAATQSFRAHASSGKLQHRGGASHGFSSPQYGEISPVEVPREASGVLGRQWQNVKAGAGAVGATVTGYVGSWVLSEETLNGIRYCEQWLQYAIHNIEQQIQALVSHLSRLKGSMSSSMVSGALLPPLRPDSGATTEHQALVNSREQTSLHRELLANVKREIVENIRRIVDILGKYTPPYLPNEAKSRIRGFLLNLPSRWATGLRVAPEEVHPGDDVKVQQDQETRKVLALASESASMLTSIASIFNQTRQNHIQN